MTQVIDHPAPSAQVSRYPIYPQAKAYLSNFLRHGRRALIRNKKYAYYQHSPTIRVLVIRLVHDIYEVRAYPWGELLVSTIEEALSIPQFVGWIFAYDYRTKRIAYITSTIRAGIDKYKLTKRAIKNGLRPRLIPTHSPNR